MPEIGQATLTVTPVLQGAQEKITNDLTEAATTAGTAAGEAVGTSMTEAISSKMSSAGDALTKGITAPIAAIGVAAVAAWNEVDAGLDTIITKTGASGEALEEMNGILEDITTSIPTDFETAGAAIGEVNTKFGATGQALEDLSSKYIKFAKLNGTDVSKSVDVTSKALAAFGLGAEDAGALLDALNATGQATGASVDSLASSLTANAPAFQELGLSIEQATVMLGQLEMSGANSETVMGGLRKALKNAAEDGIPLDQALSDLQDTILNGKDGVDGLTASYDLFGKSGDAIYNAVKNGTLDFQNLGGAIEDFGGSVDETFDATLDPMDEMTTTLNQLKLTGSDLVVAAGPLITDILGGLATGATAVTEAWRSLSPEMQTTVVAIAGVAAAAGPILSIGGAIIGGITTLTGGLGALSGGIAATGTASAAAAAPVAAAGTSLTTMAGAALQMIAAAAALYIAAQAVGVLVDAAIRITDAGGPAIAVLAGMAIGVGALMGVAAALGPALTAGAVGIGVFGAAMVGIGAGIDLASAGIARVTAAVGGLVETIAANADGINSTVANVGETFDGTVTTIADGMATVIDAISGGVSGVLDSVAGIFDSMGTAALNAGTGFEKLAGAVVNLTANTNVLDLGASLAAVAGGVDKINASASGAGDAATKVGTLTTSMTSLTTATKTSTTTMTAFGTSMSAAMLMASVSIRTANLAGSMSSAINSAYWVAAAGINNLRSLFSGTRFSFNQHIAVPHFSMAGAFDAQTGTVPSITTRWYAKAAEYGALFSTPQIIGVGDASQPELLIGLDTLREQLGTGMQVINNITVDGAEDPEEWAERFAREMQRQARMGGAYA